MWLVSPNPIRFWLGIGDWSRRSSTDPSNDRILAGHASSPEVEALILRFARENAGWGYDRSVGALAQVGREVSDQTVGNVLRKHGIAPAPKRVQTTTWKDFIRAHMAVLAGVDFFSVEVLTWKGLVTYYVLFFIHLESRRVTLAGLTRHPTEEWMQQMARNATDHDTGSLHCCRYVLHDRDTKFCSSFDSLLKAGGVTALRLPARSPNLNSLAERWVRSVKGECLSKLILFGEASLKRALTEFVAHFHAERPHQGKGNKLLFPAENQVQAEGQRIVCNERLGGLLKYYSRAA